ncbi:D-alanyl-D-alanine carboxypeptidase [Aerococcaceae bacterium zg-ZJ1578]|uniref:D-alanyl-D-alanine carboxypeptidase family protein n=1 Tax=Aerococcaceae bacterium zg-252 TaxID=2796928 RepID=UPI001A1E1A23|nr:D-alanyl-D-alanine carboxypeptidase [Aerococcaceae bacterium zg-1578]
MKISKKIMRISLLALLTSATLFSPLAAQAQVSKVPNLSGAVPDAAVADPFTMPEDYPQEIIDWFDKNIDSRSYVVVDGETNRVLAQQEGNVRYPIASMSKVASMYLVYQAIADGKLKLTDNITIPQEIEDHMSFNPEMSAMGLHAGVEYTVEELIYGVMLLSGNDATSTLMWHLYGSEQDAVKAVRQLLTSWGITNFEFYTTSGIPNQYLPESMWIEGSNETSENKMSAADVALMAQHIVTDFPEILKVTSSMSYVAKEGTEYQIDMANPNQLLPDSGSEHAREGITGLKSGVTDAAGKNFVAVGTENGRQIFAVAMGLFDPEGQGWTSYWEIEILLNKLAEFPDLYKNEALPSNLPKEPEMPAEEETTQSDSMDKDTKEMLREQGISDENRRDNPITNFMKGIFNIFK